MVSLQQNAQNSYPYPSSAFKDDGEAPIKLIEVTTDGVSRRLTVTAELLGTYIESDFGRQSDGVYAHAASSNPAYETIKFFWSRRIGDYNGDMIPIHVSKDMFSRIAPYARVPKVYPQVLVNKTATFVMATPQLPMTIADQALLKDMRDDYLTFIIHSIPGAMNHVCVGASFSYHFPTKHMFIFMHGLASANYDRFSYIIEEGAAKDTAFLTPSIVVQFNLEQRVKALNTWQDDIYWNERKLGIRFDHHDNPDPASIDYTKLSKDLNAANTNLAFLTWSCKATDRHLEFMDTVAKQYRVKAVKSGCSDAEAAQTEHLLLETHAHLRSWNTGIADRAEYLSKRGQALVQTVYSGIAQRDSAISLRLATMSTKLAETSQEVAVSTSRDSAVMRVIAAITIFFLPATFTATFFSTTFFSFNADLEGKVYSSWLWLYFVVTVVLTTVVVVGTWMLWKSKENDIHERSKKRKLGLST